MEWSELQKNLKKTGQTLYRNRSNPNKLLSFEFAGITTNIKNYVYQDTNLRYNSFEYILSGNMCIECNGKKYTANAGDIYFMRQGIDVKYYSVDKENLIKKWFSVKGELLDCLMKAYHLDGDVIVSTCAAEPEFDMMHEALLTTTPSPDATQSLAIILHKILIKMSSSNKTVDFTFSPGFSLEDQLKSFVDSELNFEYSLKMFAAQFKTTEKHLILIFKKKFGVTPYHYLMQKRIEKAKKLLLNTDLTVKAIGDVLYFANGSAFSLAFKKYSGISPSKFRAQGGHTNKEL